MSSDSPKLPSWADIRDHPLILPLYAPGLLFAITRGMLIPVLPLFVGEFTELYQLIGVILAGESIGVAVANVPAGLAVKQWGLRRTMIVGITVTVLCTTLIFGVSNIWQLFVLRILAGLGLGLYNIARHAYMAERIQLQTRGRAIALFGGIFRAGGFVGPAIGGIIAATYGLRWPFLTIGAFGIVALALVVFSVKPAPSELSANQAGRSPQKNNRPVRELWQIAVQHRQVLLAAGTGQLFAQMVRMGRQTILPLYAADILGLDVESIGYVVSISSAVDMSLFFVSGILMDRFGRKFAIVPSFFLQGIGLVLMAFTWNFTSLLLVASFIGASNGISSGTMMTLGADLAPPHTRGEFLGIWRLIGDSGPLAAPLVIGVVADFLALPVAAIILGACGLFAGATFLFFVPETLVTAPKSPT